MNGAATVKNHVRPLHLTSPTPIVGEEIAELWIVDATYDRVRDSWHKIKGDIAECLRCGYRAKERRVRQHVRQHCIRHFCHCGKTDVDRNVIVQHRKTHPISHPIYSVDELS